MGLRNTRITGTRAALAGRAGRTGLDEKRLARAGFVLVSANAGFRSEMLACA
jgi:hypothetical protein